MEEADLGVVHRVVHGVASVCFVPIQKASGLQKGRRKEEAPHKEAS